MSASPRPVNSERHSDLKRHTLSVVCLAVLACLLCFGGRAQAAPVTVYALPAFMTGGDVSLLGREEQLGAVYKDGGRPQAALSILKARGCNTLRLWVSPTGKDEAVNDLPYTVALGRRIKQGGFKLLLDIHYSDFWADPGHQTKPAAWKDLPPDQLAKTVESYSRDVIVAMRRGWAMPDMVEVGNEVTNGMLWPDSNVERPDGWRHFTALFAAGVRGIKAGAAPLPAPRIMLHISGGASAGLTGWFFGNVHTAAPALDFDVIGLSYYPEAGETLAELAASMAALARTYHKPIVIAETGFPAGGTPGAQEIVHAEYGRTPEGQARFLTDLIATVKAVPGGWGRGVLYWEIDWVYIKGLPQYGCNPLFDADFNARPAVAALGAGARSRR